MADITRYPMTRHLRGTPTVHVRHLIRGKVAHDGTGLSFFFRPLSAVLSEVPVDDRELAVLFHARTADFQDLTVQASVTFRVVDPATACARLDFSIDPDTGRWRDRILTALTADPRLAETGIAVVGARVVAIRPEPEIEKALRTPAREQIQQEADRATYERRAVAVQRERAIAENEMTNQIELARREEQLIAQRGTNARRQAEDAAAASAIEADAQAARERRLAEARAAGARALGEAKAASEAARVAAYRDLSQASLLALAAKDLAASLPQIGTLVLAPDLLTPLLSKLAAGPGEMPTSQNSAGLP